MVHFPIVWPPWFSGTLLSSDQGAPGSFPGCATEFFSREELFHGMCGLVVSVLYYSSPMFGPLLSLEEAFALN